MLAEQLAEIFDDFPSFCTFLEIRPKTGGKKSFCPESWNDEQKAFECERSGRDIVIKPRQIGMSTLELARDLHFGLTHPGSNVLVVVHTTEVKDQLFLNLRIMAESLRVRGLLPKTRYSTKTEYVFAGLDSTVRIVEAGATPASAQNKGRSGTIHRLHATEMAFWQQAGETWGALEAAIENAYEVVIESTANGAGGLFYDMVTAARAGRGKYKAHFFPFYTHRTYRVPVPVDFDPEPRDKWERKLRAAGCDDQRIAWWRAKFHSVEFGPEKTLQEYPVDADSCFRTAGRQYFDSDLVDDMFERCTEPLDIVTVRWKGRILGELRVWSRPDSRAEYVVGADVAEGTGGDADSATVIERRTGFPAATFWSDSIEPGDFGLALAAIGTMYNEAMLAPERNNHGHAALRALIHEAGYPLGRIFQTDDEKFGWHTDAVTRPVMIDDLGAAVRESLTWIHDRSTVEECKTLVRNDKGKVEARGKGKKDGCKDDRWISWAIAWQVRSRRPQEITPFKGRIPGL